MYYENNPDKGYFMAGSGNDRDVEGGNYGDAKDPVLNGPPRERKCTDILCALLCVLFVGLIIVISIWAYKEGDLNKIAMPFDSDGNPCNQGDRKDY